MDIRWKQRLQNYRKAVLQLTKFVEKENLNELEKQGLIQAFEFTHELSWKLMKDFLNYQGVGDIIGSRDAVRKAIEVGLLYSHVVWIEMIGSRNLTSHTYNEEVANEIGELIINSYFKLIEDFLMVMEKKNRECPD